MDRGAFLKGLAGGTFAMVTAHEVEKTLAETPKDRVAYLVPDKLSAAWLDGPDQPPTFFARQGYVNMVDLLNMQPGSIVRYM